MCAVVVIGCGLLHFVPVYNHAGLFIETGLSLISFATPISGMLYLSAAQVIPDAPGAPTSSAIMAFAGFFFWQVAKGRVMDLIEQGRPLLLAVAAFFLWGAGLSLMRGDSRFGVLLIFSILTGCAVLVLVRQSGNRFVPCLIAFVAGQALAMCLFWILKLHLGTPVQAFHTEIYGDSLAPGARIGTARGNANTLGPPMALAAMGVLGWFITRPKPNFRSVMIALACLLAVVPPLIGSGSRGAIMSVGAGVAFLIGIRLLAGGKSVTNTLLAVGGLVVVLLFGWHRLGMDDQWQLMQERQQMQEENTGSDLIAGRTLEWTAAVGGILNSPIVGGGAVRKLSYWDDPSMWMSHCTYLDAGLVGGIPGMLLFIWFTLTPLFKLWPRRLVPGIGWLLSVYVVSILSIGSTSSMQLKYFWMLWGMAAICFVPMPTHARRQSNAQAVKGNRKEAANMGFTKHLKPRTLKKYVE